MRTKLDRVILGALLFFPALWCLSAAAAPGNRVADPIVITGADVPSLTGIAPGDLVAFRYQRGWSPIPVQVDERAVIPFADIYNHVSGYGGSFSFLTYTDPNTFTGPDPNPTLDHDDEIVFMARDTGNKPPSFSEPPGVVPNSGVEIIVSDPLDGRVGYAYLFQQTGALDPAAGRKYVNYAFHLDSGDYKTTYHIAAGPNPEDSFITTPMYQCHFSDRWICDQLRVFAGSGVDILDRHRNLFAPGVCNRSEDTFSDGEGAFIINKSGPVRAIRGYVGANSGPLVQRMNVYYDQREDITTYLRVHAIPGVMDLFDYTPDATGMMYYNDLNPAGALIDGNPDTVTTGPISWELVTGNQGSLVTMNRFVTDIPGFHFTSYYLDNVNPPVEQCTGDPYAYGESGWWLNMSIPNTDPNLGAANIFNATRTIYYDAPGLTTTVAMLRNADINSPLVSEFQPWNNTLNTDGDGVPDVTDAFPTDPTEWADADGDGLGDNFEQTIINYSPFDAITTLADVRPQDDFDGDGYTNLEEFLNGSNPTSPASIPSLPAAQILGLLVTTLLTGGVAARALRRRHPPMA